MIKQMKIFYYGLLFFLVFAGSFKGQPVDIKNAAELELTLQKLNVLGSVLYIGAHPDDENTGALAYFSKGRKYRTAYLSLTRGDGGQNLIGSEKGVEIGILRTQELLQARSVDGAEQYFTRAIDFGYSKSAEESFNIWGKEEVLKDVVWVIRKFKPDVIITRFPVNSYGGHGHHTASAILAKEAFHAAADSTVFPEQLKFVKPWQTKRIFWNAWRPSNTEGLLSVDIGGYNTLLAKSYSEISALSRTMHKSQGFGATGSRGSQLEYFELIDGKPAVNDIFDNINTTWSRVKSGTLVGEKLKSILQNFDPSKPSASIPGLVEVYDELNKLKNGYWVDQKKKELLDIIRSCAGLWMEAIADDYSTTPGSNINITSTFVNRSDLPFKLEKIVFPTVPYESNAGMVLSNNQPIAIESKIKIPESYPISQPYWLVEKPLNGLFNIDEQRLIGKAELFSSIPVKVFVDYNGIILEHKLPLLYRWNDRVDGELYRPFEVRPPVTISISNNVSIFPNENSKVIQVKVKSNSTGINGELYLETTDGWKVSPSVIPFSLSSKYDEKFFAFEITPPQNRDEFDTKVIAKINGKEYHNSLVEISYPHINREVYFPDSEIKLVRLDIKTFDEKIAYITGSGDDIPACLRDLGYNVTVLNDNNLESADLSEFDAVITGIRAYNTNERIKYSQPKLMEYVKNGGTFIVQYNVSFGLQVDNLGPFPFSIGRNRITDEKAEINFVDPAHQLLNFPNKITREDFEGWVQERGLYFAEEWDDNYEPILFGHDPGENDLYGGMLFANYGKGVFIYSGFSWFRQLPAGVTGAYRIFANMISAGRYDGT